MLRLNLIDRAAVRRQRLAAMWKPAAVLAASAAAVSAAHAGIASRQASREIEANLVAAEARLRRARAAPSDADSLERARIVAEQRIAVLEQGARKRIAAADVLNAIGVALPARVALVEIKHDGGGLTVRGTAPDAAAVAEFGARLDSSGLFAAPVQITGTEVVSGPRPDAGVTFMLVAKLDD